jgi:predicted RNase H-like HicB family nuclease
MELTVVVHQEREEFWSEVSELPGCFASGRTLDELREALAEAVGLYLWDVAIELPDRLLPVGESSLQVTPPLGRQAGEPSG